MEDCTQFGIARGRAEAPTQREFSPIRVLFLSQQRLLRECFLKALGDSPEIMFLPPVRSVPQALQRLRSSLIDVVLVDLNPSMFGLRVARELQEGCPECRIVVLSSHADEVAAIQLRFAGVCGFISKDIGIAELISVLREAAWDQTTFASGTCPGEPFSSKVAERSLTSREAQVLELVALGFANKQVAAELGISVKTVEKHRKSVMEKLHASEAAGMIWRAFCMGVAQPDQVDMTSRKAAGDPAAGRETPTL